jgi:dipeptide transport system ATP-binding protein
VSAATAETVLEAHGLERRYVVGGGLFRKAGEVQALRGVSFSLERGRTLAVVGESGCGKSTLARLVTLIEPPSAGRLVLDGEDPGAADAGAKRRMRQKVQIVFQDPYGSLNPRKKVGSILEEPLVINTDQGKAARAEAAAEMMRRVGLRPEQSGRYPHMFSGGQRQRIAIARALMLRPKVVVLDEPVSALDLSIQAQVLNLLVELQEEFRLAYLFISHNLSVVRHFAEEVLVMYLGKAVEHGSRESIFESPQMPYTRALLASSPVADPSRRGQRFKLTGELPSPLNPPSGCPFNPRCPLANERCRVEVPALKPMRGRLVACHAVEEGREDPAFDRKTPRI